MAGWTNRGKFKALQWVFQGTAEPANYYVALALAGTVPDNATNTWSDLTEIAAGNGYVTGGSAVTPNSTDFDVLTENDAGTAAYIQIKDIVWTASGGAIPSSGNGASYAVLLDGTVAGSNVLAYWDLSGTHSVSNGQTLTIQNLQLNLTEV